jgi:hypothetical protein
MAAGPVPFVKPIYQPFQWSVIVAGFVLLLVIGWLDYLTGYEFGFFIFYSIPVGLLAWYVGRGPGIAISFASAITWLIADLYAGQKYSSQFMIYWNTGIRSVCFIINAITLAKIKQTLDQRQALTAALAESHARMARLEGVLSACPVCRNPQEDAGQKRQWQQYLDDPRATHPPQSVCPTCLERIRVNAMEPDARPAAPAGGAPSSANVGAP